MHQRPNSAKILAAQTITASSQQSLITGTPLFLLTSVKGGLRKEVLGERHKAGLKAIFRWPREGSILILGRFNGQNINFRKPGSMGLNSDCQRMLTPMASMDEPL